MPTPIASPAFFMTLKAHERKSCLQRQLCGSVSFTRFSSSHFCKVGCLCVAGGSEQRVPGQLILTVVQDMMAKIRNECYTPGPRFQIFYLGDDFQAAFWGGFFWKHSITTHIAAREVDEVPVFPLSLPPLLFPLTCRRN